MRRFVCTYACVRTVTTNGETTKTMMTMTMATATTRQHNTTHRYTENTTHTLSTLLKRNSLALSPASQTNTARLTAQFEPNRVDSTWSEFGMAYFRFSWNVLAPRATGLNSLASSRSLFYFFASNFIHSRFSSSFFAAIILMSQIKLRFSAGTHRFVCVCACVACHTVLLVGIQYSHSIALFRSLC